MVDVKEKETQDKGIELKDGSIMKGRFFPPIHNIFHTSSNWSTISCSQSYHQKDPIKADDEIVFKTLHHQTTLAKFKCKLEQAEYLKALSNFTALSHEHPHDNSFQTYLNQLTWRSNTNTSSLENIHTSHSIPVQKSFLNTLFKRIQSMLYTMGRNIKMYWRSLLFLFLWISIQCGLFLYSFFSIYNSNQYTITKLQYGTMTLCIAKGATLPINVDSCIVIVLMCRITINMLQKVKFSSWVPFNSFGVYHRWIAYSLLFWSLIHTIAHFINFTHYNNYYNGNFTSLLVLLFGSGTGMTGILLCIILLLVYFTSFNFVRSKRFEFFYYFHYLFIFYYILLCLHGTFCFIKFGPSSSMCLVPSSWKWIIGPTSLFIIEKTWREIWSRFYSPVLLKAIQHPSNVLELQFEKTSKRLLNKFQPGQYLYLNCCDISFFQWHPFTITSSPEEQYLSVHIRVQGDWTRQLANKLGAHRTSPLANNSLKMDKDSSQFVDISLNEINQPLQLYYYKNRNENLPTVKSKFTHGPTPRIFLDGAYGSYFQNIFNYEVSICIGAGIGQTPFSSLLKSIWYNLIHPAYYGTVPQLRKVYYIGICRDTQSLEWFVHILKALEEVDNHKFLNIELYITGYLSLDEIYSTFMSQSDEQSFTDRSIESFAAVDNITGLSSLTKFGRPDFERLFSNIKASHKETKKFATFYCGPKIGQLSDIIHYYCTKMTSSDQKFIFREEKF